VHENKVNWHVLELFAEKSAITYNEASNIYFNLLNGWSEIKTNI